MDYARKSAVLHTANRATALLAVRMAAVGVEPSSPKKLLKIKEWLPPKQAKLSTLVGTLLAVPRNAFLVSLSFDTCSALMVLMARHDATHKAGAKRCEALRTTIPARRRSICTSCSERSSRAAWAAFKPPRQTS